jgi:integral membrane protein (TIGR01906 family)
MIQKTRDTSLSVIFIIAVVILTITFSIGLPIYVRPFYYAHIPSIQEEFREWYDVEIETDYIKDAYDEVLDFLTKNGKEFGTGELPYSEEGKGHFEDCKVLFDLNKYAFMISMTIVVVLTLLHSFDVIKLMRPRGYSLTFIAGVGTLALFLILALLVSMDFDAAFTIFHKIFFPGKDNWLFNPNYDPIIMFMPQNFFMNCAILICSSIMVISASHIIFDIVKRRRENNTM